MVVPSRLNIICSIPNLLLDMVMWICLNIGHLSKNPMVCHHFPAFPKKNSSNPACLGTNLLNDHPEIVIPKYIIITHHPKNHPPKSSQSRVKSSHCIHLSFFQRCPIFFGKVERSTLPGGSTTSKLPVLLHKECSSPARNLGAARNGDP